MYISISFFALLIGIPSLVQLTGVFKFERKDENRVFRDRVVLRLDRLDRSPKQANEFFSDNFAFRTPLLDFYHHLKFSFFNVSPHPDQVVIGQDGWFFNSGKEISIYKGESDFTENQKASFRKYWEKKQPLLDSLQIPVYWAICPMKHYVYEDKLPFNLIRSEKQNRSLDFEKTFQSFSEIRFLDLKSQLDSARSSGLELYYKMDNHWNYTAGKIVSDFIVKRLRNDFPNDSISDILNFDWNDSLIHTGIHYQRIGVSSLSEVASYPKINQAKFYSYEADKYGFPSIPGFPYPWEYELRFKNDSIKNGLKVLIFRDSFSHQVIPFLRESFNESVFIFDAWKYQINDSIVSVVKPDLILILSLESNIENCIQ